jgi:hypothetical protein
VFFGRLVAGNYETIPAIHVLFPEDKLQQSASTASRYRPRSSAVAQNSVWYRVGARRKNRDDGTKRILTD